MRAEVARPSLRIADLPARLGDRYRKLVANLQDALGRDAARARAALRELCGDIRVAPHESGDYLVAELRLNEKPLLLAVSGSPVPVRAHRLQIIPAPCVRVVVASFYHRPDQVLVTRGRHDQTLLASI